MSKRFITILFVITVVLSVAPLHTLAENPAFSDVPPDSWAAGVIDSALKGLEAAKLKQGILLF